MPRYSPSQIPQAWRELLLLIPGYDSIKTAPDGCWFDSDAAQDAIDFFPECLCHVEGALAGQPFALEPWQKSFVANLMGWKQLDEFGREVRRYRETLLYVARKNGKCLALDTPLPTPTGWKMMGDVQDGDTLFDETGATCRVVKAFDVKYGLDCYRVTFSDGTSIVADADHLWETRPRRSRRPRAIKGSRRKQIYFTDKQIFTTEQIMRDLTVNCPSNIKKGVVEFNHRLDACGALQTSDALLPIDPYVLGCWLGDGDSDCGRMTLHPNDDEILRHIELAGVATKRMTTGYRVRLGSGVRGNAFLPSFRKDLRNAGVLCNKHIPREYLRASIAQRLALMQGLMDTDGYASKAGQCEFTSVLPALRDGFIELARSLGYKTTCSEARATIRGADCGPKWRIRFWAYSDQSPFRLRRKSARLKSRPEKPTRASTRQIVSVEPVPSVPVRCVAVDSPSRLFLAGKGMVQTHNSPLVAGLALLILATDDEKGQQDYVAAGEREQAGMLFRQCKGMVEHELELQKRFKVYGGGSAAGQSKSIVREADNSFMRVISADAETKHGGNTHLAIIDELHVQPNRDLVDVLQTSMASANRKQPLLILITTADYDRPSICNEKHDYASKVRDGIIDDPRFLPVIYEVDRKDKWDDETVWRKANPNLGVSVSLDYLRAECKRAKEIPAYENTFRRLHLNQITTTAEKCIPMDQWDACKRSFTLADMDKRDVHIGLDIGATSDFTAMILLFPEPGGDVIEVPVDYEKPNGEKKTITRRTYKILSYFWLPECPVKRDQRMQAVIDGWRKEGHIRTTHGTAVDYDQVLEDMIAITSNLMVSDIAFDRGFQGSQMGTNLMDHFGPNLIVQFPQGFLSFNAPFREMLELLALGRLHHDGNPVLRWMASNTMSEKKGGLIKPSKDASPEKIDGIAALCMALGRASVTGSVYENRGVLTI